jgi:hypothetical protein
VTRFKISKCLDSKSIRHTLTIREYKSDTFGCSEDDAVLTIDKATYSSIKQPNCSLDVRDIIKKLCNKTTSSKTCTINVMNEQLGNDPCVNHMKQLKIDYTCTLSSKYTTFLK